MEIGQCMLDYRKLFFGLVFSILALGLLSFSYQEASAATVTWTGGGLDNNWSTAANWNPGVPGLADTVNISTPACPTTQLTGIVFDPPSPFIFTGILNVGQGCFLIDQSGVVFTNQGGTIIVNGNYFVTKWTNSAAGIVTVNSPGGQLVFGGGATNNNFGEINVNDRMTVAGSATRRQP